MLLVHKRRMAVAAIGAALFGSLHTKPSQGASAAKWQVPIYFEPNHGQIDPKVKFLSRGTGYQLFLTDEEAVLVLHTGGRDTQWEPSRTFSQGAGTDPVHEKTSDRAQAVVRLRMLGGCAQPRIVALEKQPGRVNYLIGSDPSRWRTGLQTYARVRYEEVYPGIDLIYYGQGRQIEYDFVVAPQADPSLIRIGIDGVEDLAIDAEGDLILRTTAGEIRQSKPVIYQEEGAGGRRQVAGRYQLLGHREVGFEVGAYNLHLPLVIDPLIYATYLGGNGFDIGNGIAVDDAGQAYITGDTRSIDFPTQNALDTSLGGGQDAFVSKLAADGKSLVYSTYLGGLFSLEMGLSIAVDAAGRAYVTGMTCSYDFPTHNAIDSSLGGSCDAFVSKLAADGSSLLYSTYLGGSGMDWGNEIAVDQIGTAYLTGVTDSIDFPIPNAFDTTLGGSEDAFVSKLAADGSSLEYSTYLGGADFDQGHGIAVDAAGQAYVTGSTTSNDFPLVDALDTTYGGARDAFISKLAADGKSLIYSTYLGGADFDQGHGIAVDTSGQAYVTGSTNSADFPTHNAFDGSLGGSRDAFVTKLAPNGASAVYSTYLGGTSFDSALGIAVDDAGHAYLTGSTLSADFPTHNAFDSSLGGIGDAFVTKLAADGASVVYSTYLGEAASTIVGKLPSTGEYTLPDSPSPPTSLP